MKAEDDALRVIAARVWRPLAYLGLLACLALSAVAVAQRARAARLGGLAAASSPVSLRPR